MKGNRTAKKRSLQSVESVRHKIVGLLIVLTTVLFVPTCSLMMSRGIDPTLQSTFFATCFSFLLTYLLYAAYVKKCFDYDNELHPFRFLIVYLLCLFFALCLPQMSISAWPAVLMFVWLTFVSDRIIGFVAGTGLLFLACMFVTENPNPFFLMYTATGACAVNVFSDIDQQFSKGRAILFMTLVQAGASVFCVVLFRYQPLTFEQFVLPIVGMALSAFGLLLLSAWFSSVYLKRDRDRYMDINDPEFSLLTAIRSKNKEEYFRALHGAYLTEKAATALKLRVQAAKTLAYYKRIGCLDDTDSVWEETEHYFVDFEFPEDAVLLLKEYMIPNYEKSKECAVAEICDDLVVTLSDIFKKDKDARVDYDDTIDKLLTTAVEKKSLKNSDISLRDLEELKTLLKQEKLYYDFLR